MRGWLGRASGPQSRNPCRDQGGWRVRKADLHTPLTFTLTDLQTCLGYFPMRDEQGIGLISELYAEGEGRVPDLAKLLGCG